MIVQVKLSARRKKTVSAVLNGDTVVISLPKSMPKKDREIWIGRLLEKVRLRKSVARSGDKSYLEDMAESLNSHYLDGKAAFFSIEWSSRQKKLFGSCSPLSGKIRISERVKYFPHWVIEYIVLHELAHLIHPDHCSAFYDLVKKYERCAEAEAFLLGYSYA